MKGIEHLQRYKMCPLEHLFDNHELCDSSWCEKKRKLGCKLLDGVIRKFDEVLTNEVCKETATFNRGSIGYYPSKAGDKEVYDILKKEFEKYVSLQKLTECCHEFDTNINESLNNIVAKYAPKTKNLCQI